MTQQQKKILIVDDKSVNRYILSGIFENEYDIQECADGSEAIEALERAEKIRQQYCWILLCPHAMVLQF